MSLNPYSLPFDGATYEPEVDSDRLGSQLHAVYRVMADGHWRTLHQIQHALRERVSPDRDSEAGISARLRDLRKAKWGGHRVDRRRIAGGLFEYRLVLHE